jgi:acyl carrier protein
MNASELIAEITRSNVKHYPDETLLSALENWDSLKGVRLVLRIEEIIGRPLAEEELERLESVGDVGRFLRAQG